MTELSRIADMAEILGAVIVIGGLFFAVLQMRQIRQQRRELAAIELFRFFGNPNFAEAYQTILHMPDGVSAGDMRSEHNDLEDAAMLIGTTMENIGVMTFQRIVPFVVVNNLIGTSAPVLWRKLEIYAKDLREELGEDTAFEWFQWLAERLEQYNTDGANPAYRAHSDWLPLHQRQEL